MDGMMKRIKDSESERQTEEKTIDWSADALSIDRRVSGNAVRVQ